jgi:nucleoside 2-deoxyribosyltransferase
VQKVYISAPFRFYTTDEKNRFYGVLDDEEYKQFLQKIDSKLKSLGFETCLPHRDEGHWGHIYILPEDVAEICFKHIQSSDFIIVFPHKSRGVHIEIGYAAALHKKMIVFLFKDERESTLLRGLSKVTDFKCFRYQSLGEVLSLLETHLGR